MMNKLVKALVLASVLQLSILAEAVDKKKVKGASPQIVTSLAAAVRSAMQSHPSLSAIENSRKSIKSDIDAAKGELYPSVDVRAGIGREESENSTVLNAGDQHLALTRSDASVTIRQNLFSGFRISNSIERSKHRAAEAFHSHLNEKERTAFNAIDAYLEYHRNKELIRLSSENVKVHEDILNIVTTRKKSGKASSADVIQVKGRLALAKAQLQRELANREAVKAQFIEAIVAKPSNDLASPVQNNNKLPKSLKSAINKAITTHPLLSARARNIEASRAAVGEAASAFYPQVALEVNLQENDNTAGTRSNSDSASAMLVVNWNLFRGGADKATKASRLFQVSQGEDLLLDEKRKIERDVIVTWQNYKGTLVELNYFKQHEKASKETLIAYRKQYKLLKRTLFDLLNSQNELFLASSRVIETEYSKIRSVYTIFANMGNVSDLFTTK